MSSSITSLPALFYSLLTGCSGILPKPDSQPQDSIPVETLDSYIADTGTAPTSVDDTSIFDSDLPDSDGADCYIPDYNSNDVDLDGYADVRYGGDDCDDGNRSINPAAQEICDGIDNNCDGQIDPITSEDAFATYSDMDGDGYGNPATAAIGCDIPSGRVLDSTDCDDSVAAISPGVLEDVCDSIDNNCDGVVGAASSETFNAIDDDCDGLVDEGPFLMDESGIEIVGDTSSDNLGFDSQGIANAGDINGDGIEDLILGAPYSDANGTQSGAAYLVWGGALSGSHVATDVAAGIWLGETVYQRLGVVSSAGDFDGDGYSDYMTGSYQSAFNGEVYLNYGDTVASATDTVDHSAVIIAW